MRAPVEEILIDKNTMKTTGVRVCGREIKAPIVVSSCGYPTTFQKLVPEYVFLYLSPSLSLSLIDIYGYI